MPQVSGEGEEQPSLVVQRPIGLEWIVAWSDGVTVVNRAAQKRAGRNHDHVCDTPTLFFVTPKESVQGSTNWWPFG